MKDRMMSCQLLRINIHWCKRPTSVALTMNFLIVAILISNHSKFTNKCVDLLSSERSVTKKMFFTSGLVM